MDAKEKSDNTERKWMKRNNGNINEGNDTKWNKNANKRWKDISERRIERRNEGEIMKGETKTRAEWRK